jgi:outer membrane protein TolC
MNGTMKLAIYSIICIILLTSPLSGQQTLTLENALEIAFENNPDIRQAKLNFESAQHYLDARNAALKTQISLRLTPIGLSKYEAYRSYGDTGWEKTKEIYSNGYLSISQPIKWTDGTLELAHE